MITINNSKIDILIIFFILINLGCLEDKILNKDEINLIIKNQSLKKEISFYIEKNKNCEWYALALNFVDTSFSTAQIFQNKSTCKNYLDSKYRKYIFMNKTIYILTGEECIFFEQNLYEKEIYNCLNWNSSTTFFLNSKGEISRFFEGEKRNLFYCGYSLDSIYFQPPKLKNN